MVKSHVDLHRLVHFQHKSGLRIFLKPTDVDREMCRPRAQSVRLSPLDPVAVEPLVLVSVFVERNRAPMTMLPLGSVTLPVTVAVVCCPNAAVAASPSITRARRIDVKS